MGSDRNILGVGGIWAWWVLIVFVGWGWPAWGAEPLVVEVPMPRAETAPSAFHMGTAKTPDGHELTVNGQSLLRDGKPWLPVMGEFHFSRYPANEWRDELLKMKAGGIDVVSTYIFWIHHEEVEGKFDWTGQRDLRQFVMRCGEVGLPVVLRCGPWDHGEVRNGGFPDWLLKKGFKVRTDDPGYLAAVAKLYGEIAGQVKGLLWKDGGPVIGVQVENEFSGPATHLLTLKRMAREAGLDVPMYTRTGWPNLRGQLPFGELLPLYGAYAEGFWDRVLTPMPGDYWKAFTFELVRTDTAVATDQLGARQARDAADAGSYPYLTCELGGGMMTSYHRRIKIEPEDIAAVAIAKIGSGSNLPGYYMYHGGTNPAGLTPLQESQATAYWNDMPEKGYDFQAPLGEFGQIHPQYHLLRRIHLFLNDFGEQVTGMGAVIPAAKVANGRDAATLRWAVRSDGASGLIFVNNYQRGLSMPAHEGVQFALRLPGAVGAVAQTVNVPDEPVRIPADSSFFWPFNWDIGGAKLIYATAQPVCRVEDGGTEYMVFAQTAVGVPSDFIFDAAGVQVEASHGEVSAGAGRIAVKHVQPGTGAAIRLRAGGKAIALILLNDRDSLACWKGTWEGRERIVLSQAGVMFDGAALRLRSAAVNELNLAMLPAPESLMVKGKSVMGTADGVFRRFASGVAAPGYLTATVEMVKAAGSARVVAKSKRAQGVAEAPTEEDFAAAGEWRIKLPDGTDPQRDLRLRIYYFGDVARAYLGGTFLTDNFYNGDPFEVGLKRYGPAAYKDGLVLKVLPLSKGAPIYFPAEALRDHEGSILSASNTVKGREVEVLEDSEATFTAPAR